MPEPYYDDGTCVIYHGDCREYLYATSAADALAWDTICADPPYGTNSYATDRDVQDVLVRLLHFRAAVFGWPEALVAACVEARVVPTEWVTWWPTNAAMRSFNPSGALREVECIAVFGETAFGSLREERSAKSASIVAAGYVNGSTRVARKEVPTRRIGDLWTDPSPGLGFNSHVRVHPNEKPLTLMRRLIEGVSNAGDVVLDPFMGSGTTLRAAKDLGRRAIGIEVEERYCEIAAKRLAQEVLPL